MCSEWGTERAARVRTRWHTALNDALGSGVDVHGLAS
jgi:hypothetical protein